MWVSYDPGARAVGVALWEDGELTAAFLARGKSWHHTASVAFRRVCEHVPMALIERFVIEVPQVYTQRKQKGDPNDLITVALNAGAFGMFAAMCSGCGAEIIEYRPHQWKGQAPKDVAIKRFQKRLSNEERDRVEKVAKSLQHNVWDAVGLGLYDGGRRL